MAKRFVGVCMAFAGGAILASCAQLPTASSTERQPVSPSEGPAPSTSAAAGSPTQATAPIAAPNSTNWKQRGQISLYGKGFAGKPTASGDAFDPERMTMAHRTLPFGTLVRVTNLENQRSVEVVVNDRGPFVPGRIADLSTAAARQIGMVMDGVVDAVLEVLPPSKAR